MVDPTALAGFIGNACLTAMLLQQYVVVGGENFLPAVTGHLHDMTSFKGHEVRNHARGAEVNLQLGGDIARNSSLGLDNR